MSEKIKEVIKKRYTEAVTLNNGCCGPSCCSPEDETTFSENYSKVEGYQKDADYGLGCGIPTEHAHIKKGDTVLDLGSGAGNDVFVAQRIVGESGKIIGVDMTQAMIDKANENKRKLGYTNVDFRLGEIENLPLESGSVDVVVSNCVLNLVPDKTRAFFEIYRVLKKGGHFSISDIVLEGSLPESIANVAELYASCVSGALEKKTYLDIIKQTGFLNISVVKERQYNLSDDLILQFVGPTELKAYRESRTKILSITVYAEKA